MKAMYGRKVGMTRLFTEQGLSVPVTVLLMEPNVVYQVKSVESDGYSAVQIGIGQQKPQRIDRALTGHLAKAKKGFPKAVKEIRLEEDSGMEIGQTIEMGNVFSAGARVDVVGNSVGKGFAGVMKRHKMKGFTRTHGTHEYFRHGGSIGCRKFPGRVFKNKRMGGHMGDVRVMQQGLEVVEVRAEQNLLLVKGSIPGPKNGVVYVRASIKQ